MTDPAPPSSSTADCSPERADRGDAGRSSTARLPSQIVESLQTVLTALMLAFMFRAFFVEAFIIPTGSMAPSLLGQHGVLVCPHCGWEIDYGPKPGQTGRQETFIPPQEAFCPNCHRRSDLRESSAAVKSGDRILVHKWPYAVGSPLGPRRWDVIVFRDPSDQSQNYIKRLVALPGETIEILDGDVFIKPPGAGRFHVARKTSAAQKMLWFVVFDQDYLPADRDRRPYAWVAEPTTGRSSAGWSGLGTRVLRYDARDHTPRAVLFNPSVWPHYLKDVYGYNHGPGGNYVGDVRIVAQVALQQGEGSLRWEIIRDGRRFAVRFDHDGRVLLTTDQPASNSVDHELVLGSAQLGDLCDGRPRVLEFAHLDYRVYLKVDGRQLLATTDEQYHPNLDELRASRRIAPLGLRLVAEHLSLELRGLRVERDVYYTTNRPSTRRAFAGQPFRLGRDEYFVLGDNSPNSHDSREWYDDVGPHLKDAFENDTYQLGTVRADQIVGKAFFVYLPGLLPLDQKGVWRIPDLGRVRFIR